MAILKCKMCGGDLSVSEGAAVAECQFCGRLQTVPRTDDEAKLKRLNRAHFFRNSEEFDKSAGIYETVVAEFPEEAEAYWGLVLCRYGIEYVTDPATGQKVPTCNRTGYSSVLEDPNFKLALQYAASEEARALYRAEAEQLETIRLNILAVSAREEPYDVFLCYKETDQNTGERTEDSVEAQKVYDALTAAGYRVFFSRITLENKLGEHYEPYIFAALQSAKVMLVVASNSDYVNSPWVRNEWSRYLKLMETDRSKHLIPCYFHMSPDELPRDLPNLQGQDMTKVGFLQDLVRGVKKLIPPTSGTEAEPTVEDRNSGTAPLLRRGELLLETGSWEEARACYQKLLEQAPENARGYVGKYLAEKKQPNLSALKQSLCMLPTESSAGSALTEVQAAARQKKAVIDEFSVPGYLYGDQLEQLLNCQTTLPDWEREPARRLKALQQEFSENPDFIFAKRFGDDRLRGELEDLERAALSCAEAALEQARLRRRSAEEKLAYDTAAFLRAKRPEVEALQRKALEKRDADYRGAAELEAQKQYSTAVTWYNRVGDYLDARERARSCQEADARLRQEVNRKREQEDAYRSKLTGYQFGEMDRSMLKDRLERSKQEARLFKLRLTSWWWLLLLTVFTGPFSVVIWLLLRKRNTKKMARILGILPKYVKSPLIEEHLAMLNRSIVDDTQRLEEIENKLKEMG